MMCIYQYVEAPGQQWCGQDPSYAAKVRGPLESHRSRQKNFFRPESTQPLCSDTTQGVNLEVVGLE
jgi:hypothetical protein